MTLRLTNFLLLLALAVVAVSGASSASETSLESTSHLTLQHDTVDHMRVKPKCKKPKKPCKICKKKKKGVKKCKFVCKKKCGKDVVVETPMPVDPCEFSVKKLPAKTTRAICKCPEKNFVSEYTASGPVNKCVRDCVSSSTRLIDACDQRKFFMEFRSVVNACCQATCGGTFSFFEDKCVA